MQAVYNNKLIFHEAHPPQRLAARDTVAYKDSLLQERIDVRDEGGPGVDCHDMSGGYEQFLDR